MHARPHRPPAIPAPRRVAALLAFALVLAGCAGAPGPARTTAGSQGGGGGRAVSVPLAPGRGSPPPPARLAAAARLARRFARAWAVDVYRRRPPLLPGETAAVGRELAAAAIRVPQARRRLRARLLGLRLRPGGPRRVLASASFGDGRFPSFSVGFVLADRGGRWVVTSISPPD